MQKMAKPLFSPKETCIVGVFTALTVILSLIAIPLPFTPVQLSLGWFAVFLCGMLLRPKCAVFAQLCYLMLGAVGLPVFQGFRGGLGALLGPTGGYLFVYPLMAGIISLALNSAGAADLSHKGLMLRSLLALTASALIGYLCGTLWLCTLTGSTFLQGLSMAVLPFLPLDIAKVVITVPLALPIRGRLQGLRVTL